jgi:LRR receptor-like serine/threonine-protein kinase FLS2
MFSGRLPSLQYNTALQDLEVFDNRFTGTIPTHYGNLQIMHLALSNNMLSGTIPSSFTNSTYLTLLAVGENQLTGTLPSTFAIGYSANSMLMINFILMQNNYLSGNINVFALWHNLSTLNVSSNLFSGCFCEGSDPVVFYLKNISSIDVSNNAFTGSSIGNLLSEAPFLLTLNVAKNKFSGPLSNVFYSHSLVTLDVSDNAFTGSIPWYAFANKQLISFTALKNCLTGSLPVTKMCESEVLESLALDGLYTAEKCQDRFFPGISSARSYQVTQKIQGGMASMRCLFNMSRLQTLHLSGNAITGSLPWDLVIGDSLRDLSLSYNQLTGSIPKSMQEKKN